MPFTLPLDEKIQKILEQFNPSKNVLLEWFQDRIDDKLLGVIAAADYGSDYREHFAILSSIRDEFVIPVPLEWHPSEVLELIRWSEPSDPEWKPGLTGRDGHLIRAFACTVLLMAAADPANTGYFSGEIETLVQLVASSIELGQPVMRLALQLVVWRVLFSKIDDEEAAFFAMAVLLLVVALRPKNIEGLALKQLADWVIAVEAQVRELTQRNYQFGVTRWLLDLTYSNLKEDTWLATTRKILLDPSMPHPPEADEILRLIGTVIN